MKFLILSPTDFVCIETIQWRQLTSITQYIENKHLNNSEATKLLKQLSTQYQHEANKKVIQNIFQIYDKINERKSHFTLNMIFKLFLKYSSAHKLKIIWNDIVSVMDKSKLHYNELIKCCIMADTIDIKKCIQTLKWMQQFNYKLSIHPRYLTQLITKCGSDLESLKYIHSIILNNDNIIIQTALINAFAQCQEFESAQNVFRSIPKDKYDIICVGAMMKALVNTENFEQALKLYDNITASNNIHHDIVTHLLSIKACTESGNKQKGKEIIAGLEFDRNDIQIVNTLINFYANCMDLENALKLFNSVDDRKKNIITIGAMMDAYCKCHKDKECLELYQKAISFYKLQPDIITYIIALTSCTNGTIYHFGKQIHDELKQNTDNHWMLNNIEIQTGLINMYGKCGQLVVCEQIFDDIKQHETDKYHKETVIWNAMIHAYGRNGDIDKAQKLYHKMKNEIGVDVDSKTYILLLNALSHSGEVTEAKDLWENEIIDANIKYDEYVMTSLVDCFSRRGMLQEAYKKVVEYEENMKNGHNEIMWMTLLSGCNKSSDKSVASMVCNEYEKRFGRISDPMSTVL